jgi:hypothetical protein
MSTSHHAEIFLQARGGVGDEYGQASALPATPAHGSVTSTNEPGHCDMSLSHKCSLGRTAWLQGLKPFVVAGLTAGLKPRPSGRHL